MKILSILISLVFSLNAIAAAPYGFRGQNQTSTQYSNVLQFPNSQVTKLAGINSLVETGNKNILLNPDFEHNTFNSSWTATTVTPAVETTAIISGKKSVILSPSAQTFTFVQDSTLYASNFQGSTQLLAMVWIRTNQSGITVCSRNDGVTSTTNCVTVAPQSPSVWQLIKVPFISSSTSNGISIAASSAITGNVYIDDAFVGAVDLKTDSNIITPWIAYTPTYTGFGTVTGSEMQWRQVGGNVEVRGKFTSGTSTAVEARISLPNSYTSASSSVIPSLQVVGFGSRNVANPENTQVLIEPSVNYMTFARQDGSVSGLVKSNGSAVLGSGQSLSFFSSIPIAGLQGSVSTYSASCGANCVDNFSFDASTTGVVTADDLDFVNGNASSIANTSEYTYTFNSGKLTATPSCEVTAVSNGAVEINAQIMTVSSSAITVRLARTSDEVNTVSAHTIFCKKTGADFVSSRTIVGSFNEVMNVPNVSKPKKCIAIYGTGGSLTAPAACSGTPCAEYFDNCGTASATRSSGGTYVNTWAAGTWAANTALNCGSNAKHPGSVANRLDFIAPASDASGGAVYTLVSQVSAANTDTTPTFWCEGQAP